MGECSLAMGTKGGQSYRIGVEATKITVAFCNHCSTKPRVSDVVSVLVAISMAFIVQAASPLVDMLLPLFKHCQHVRSFSLSFQRKEHPDWLWLHFGCHGVIVVRWEEWFCLKSEYTGKIYCTKHYELNLMNSHGWHSVPGVGFSDRQIVAPGYILRDFAPLEFLKT